MIIWLVGVYLKGHLFLWWFYIYNSNVQLASLSDFLFTRSETANNYNDIDMRTYLGALTSTVKQTPQSLTWYTSPPPPTHLGPLDLMLAELTSLALRVVARTDQTSLLPCGHRGPIRLDPVQSRKSMAAWPASRSASKIPRLFFRFPPIAAVSLSTYRYQCQTLHTIYRGVLLFHISFTNCSRFAS